MKEDKVYIDFHPLGIDVSIVPIPFIIGDEYIRKDALLEYLTERRKGLSSGDSFVAGERKMLKEIIEKIESL